MRDQPAKADPPAEFLRRLFAASAAALVLLFSVASASPSVHQWLHGGHAPESGDACAIAQFAAGVTFAAAAIAVATPRPAWRADVPRAAAEIFLTPIRYLRLPERGPPVR
jgi:hypothetical protein